jgi:hypothetical protein
MHPGGSFGYQANVLRFPEQGLSVVILANASPVPAMDLSFEIADIYLAEEFPAEDAPSTAVAGPRPGFRLFRGPDAGDVVILSTRPDGTSRIATLSYKVELVATGPSTFRAVNSGLPVVAKVISGAAGGRNRLEVQIEDQDKQVYEELARALPNPADREAKLGEYFSAELGATVRLVGRRGQLAIDDSEMAMPIPPFLSISRDTAVSDRGVQLDFIRDGDGEVTGVYLSTGRARRILLIKK